MLMGISQDILSYQVSTYHGQPTLGRNCIFTSSTRVGFAWILGKKYTIGKNIQLVSLCFSFSLQCLPANSAVFGCTSNPLYWLCSFFAHTHRIHKKFWRKTYNLFRTALSKFTHKMDGIYISIVVRGFLGVLLPSLAKCKPWDITACHLLLNVNPAKSNIKFSQNSTWYSFL